MSRLSDTFSFELFVELFNRPVPGGRPRFFGPPGGVGVLVGDIVSILAFWTTGVEATEKETI